MKALSLQDAIAKLNFIASQVTISQQAELSEKVVQLEERWDSVGEESQKTLC